MLLFRGQNRQCSFGNVMYKVDISILIKLLFGQFYLNSINIGVIVSILQYSQVTCFFAIKTPLYLHLDCHLNRTVTSLSIVLIILWIWALFDMVEVR